MHLKHDEKMNVVEIRHLSNAVFSGLIATNTGNQFGMRSFSYNQEYSALFSDLSAKRLEYQDYVDKQLAIDQNFKEYRSNGVSLAWEYEKADIQMGGSGSENFTLEQRAEILDRGRVRGFEGHHIKNVANHKIHQANPDNIKFYSSREEHIELGHDGDAHNPSDGEFINRDNMITMTNRRRVMMNEIKGLGVSAAIGFGVGVTLSAIVELSQSSMKAVDMPRLIKRSLLSGIEGAGLSSASYVAGRGVSYAMESFFKLDPTTVVGGMINTFSVGTISAAIGVIYQLTKMRIMGMPKEMVMEMAGKQATISMLSVALTSLAQGLYGGAGGIIAFAGFAFAYLGVIIKNNIHNNMLREKINAYTVEQYKPIIQGA